MLVRAWPGTSTSLSSPDLSLRSGCVKTPRTSSSRNCRPCATVAGIGGQSDSASLTHPQSGFGSRALQLSSQYSTPPVITSWTPMAS